MMRKREGFKGQKAIVLPHYVQKELRSGPRTKLLFVTDVGYYPSALYHFRERLSGSAQNILIYCIDGKGFIEIDGINRSVNKNQFFIIPAHIPHRYGSEESNPWTIYWVHFTGDIANRFVNASFSVADLNPEENKRNDRRIRLFEEIYQTLSMGFSTENIEYSSICLWYLLGSFQFISQFERIRSINQHDIIEKTILFMQDNINSRISLSDLAKQSGLSVSQFSLVFKKKTLRSPMDYYNNLRIQNACQMLDFTDMSIKEISSQLDFEDQFYFSRTFKKIMGYSPLEYRKRRKG
jgi:AraC family transcriptional regulator, arabinose operon regulatory protein